MERTGEPRFRDRADAGRRLAELLTDYAGRDDVVVLGLPRGGVPVAFEVAQALRAPLDVFVVRKLGLPGQEELAMGAIASGGVRTINRDVVDDLRLPEELIASVAEREAEVLLRREALYRGDRPPLDLAGRTAILVDDGLATGASMRAAVAALRALGPARVVAAVPTAPRETVAELAAEMDDLFVLITPSPFLAVGRWYDDFSQTTDDEVRALLAERADLDD